MSASPATVVGGLFLVASIAGTIVFFVNSADHERIAREGVKSELANAAQVAGRTAEMARASGQRVRNSEMETKGYLDDVSHAREELSAKGEAMEVTAARHREAKQREEAKVGRLTNEIALTRNELSQTLVILQSLTKEPTTENPGPLTAKPPIVPTASLPSAKTLQDRLGALEKDLGAAELNITANADVERAAKALAEQLHRAEQQAAEAAARLAELTAQSEEKQRRLKALEEKVRAAQRRLSALLDEVDKRP